MKKIILSLLISSQLLVQAADLEVAVSLPFRPGNVTVTKMGEVFSTSHALDASPMQLFKVNSDKTYTAFPSAAWQHKAGEAITDKVFDTPLGITSDSNGNIWLVDMGFNYGKTRIFGFEVATGKLIQTITLPETIAPKSSFVQDLAVDVQNGFIYLADIANPGIIVVDMKKNTFRRLAQYKQVMSEDVDTVIDGKVIYFGGKPARVGVNPITLSKDANTLYFGPMNGKQWYSVDAKLLRSQASDEMISKAIQVVTKKPISDGVATDAEGNHYFTNLSEKGIDKYDAKTKQVVSLIKDKRLDWVDNVAVYNNTVYVAVNQLHKTPAFTGDKDLGKAPYFIYKFNMMQ